MVHPFTARSSRTVDPADLPEVRRRGFPLRGECRGLSQTPWGATRYSAAYGLASGRRSTGSPCPHSVDPAGRRDLRSGRRRRESPGSAITAGARCCSVEDAWLETTGRILVKFFQTAESANAPSRCIYLSLGGAHTDNWGSPGLWLASRTTPQGAAAGGSGRGVGPGPCAFLTDTRGGSLSGVTNPMLTG